MGRIKIVYFLILCGFLLFTIEAFAQSKDRPIPISAPIPAYPAMARAKRISGTVLVDLQVNAAGNVIDAVAIMGKEYLRDAAKKAALGWRFQPSQSLQTLYTVRVTFIFHDFSYEPPEKKPDFRSPYQIEILYPLI